MLTGSRTPAGASCAPGASTGAPTGGKQVGQEGGSCTLVDLQQGSVNCAGGAELRKGQISFQGLTTAEATKELVVTGGTGAYLGAEGSVTLVELGNGKGSLTFKLRRS